MPLLSAECCTPLLPRRLAPTGSAISPHRSTPLFSLTAVHLQHLALISAHMPASTSCLLASFGISRSTHQSLHACRHLVACSEKNGQHNISTPARMLSSVSFSRSGSGTRCGAVLQHGLLVAQPTIKPRPATACLNPISSAHPPHRVTHRHLQQCLHRRFQAPIPWKCSWSINIFLHLYELVPSMLLGASMVF